MLGLPWPRHGFADSRSLRERADAKGLVFGCAVKSPQLGTDMPYTDLIATQANMLVHEYELKRKNVEPSPGQYVFAGADKAMNFAADNGQAVRGHTLCWFQANPDWLEDALMVPVAQREQLLISYIDRVIDRYGSRMQSWDVVNEVIEPQQADWNGMRTDNPWWRALGERHIDIAFHAAKEKAGEAKLYLNDYSVENDVRWNEDRRNTTLRLLERLKKRDVPIEGYGIQGHLKPYRDRFEPEVFAKFLRELEGFGLQVMVTEFDVADVDGPADPAERDADIAAVTKSFLDTALDSPACAGVLCWGITDEYSWLSDLEKYKRADGTKTRGLPYDDQYRPKPMWDAIAAALDAAPARVPT